MKIIEVVDKQTKQEWHEVPRILYKNDPNYAYPLDVEIENLFDPNENSSFKQGDAIRWALKDDTGKLIGRVGAFYNTIKANLNNDQPTGGIGFFECINDIKAATLLFDTAKEWLKKNGMAAMDGPITFGENITYWGLLIEGFTQQSYGMQYHPPYYKELFEKYGFQIYFEQNTYRKELAEKFPERQEKFARHYGEKGNFSFDHYTEENQDKYIDHISYIFNEVWKDFHEDYTPMDRNEVKKVFLNAKDIVDDELLLFAYDEGKPVAMIIILPDANQVTKKMKGKLNTFTKLKFVMNKKKIDRGRLLMTGVIPSHQRTYIIGALFIKMVDAMRAKGYKTLEMSWVGDYNITVNKIYTTLGIPIVIKHATYRYLFDRNAEFKRFTNETSNKMKKTLKKEV